MKVLVCIPCLLNGGTEIQTLSLIEALIAAGHKPVVACYFEHDATMVERYRNAGASVRLMSYAGKRPKGLKATALHLWKGLKEIVKDEQPNVAHVQYMAPGALPVIILRILAVKRIIATSHTFGDIYGKNGLRTIKFLTRFCLTAFQCITLRAEESYFGNASLFDGKLKKHFTIYNSLPSHISITQNPRGRKYGTITIGVVSRLANIKGMDLVIPAYEKIRQSSSSLRLLIVGDGELRSLMEKQAKTTQFSDEIGFVGLKPQGELQGWYDKIDILLMPSRSEGFGLTAIEGMARGCVPVVANVGGLTEVVNENCGRLHEAENIDDMVLKIKELIDNLYELSKEAIVQSSNFSASNYKNAICNLYNSLS